jgi:hypothetical protein
LENLKVIGVQGPEPFNAIHSILKKGINKNYK